MKRFLETEIRDRFFVKQERLILYGLPFVGKTHLLRFLQNDRQMKSYVLCDLTIDRELTAGIKKTLSGEESLCRFLSEYFGMKEDYVRDSLSVFMDGLENLGEDAAYLESADLPKHFAATTSRIDVYGISRDSRKTMLSFVKVSPFSFYEFLEAVEEKNEIAYTGFLRLYKNSEAGMPEHLAVMLRELFHDYMLTGGFPDAIEHYRKNRNDLSEIRRVQGSIYASIILRLQNSLPDGLSEVKIRQLLSYIRQYSDDNRGKFHPGHIRRGAMQREFESEIRYLCDFGLLIPIYDETGGLYRFELCDCGLTRYLCNDYDMFYRLGYRDSLPEYFYQNYFYSLLHSREKKIFIKKSDRSHYLCYTDGTIGFRHSSTNRAPLSYDSEGESGGSVNAISVYRLIDHASGGKNGDHNIQYFSLEQTQF